MLAERGRQIEVLCVVATVGGAGGAGERWQDDEAERLELKHDSKRLF